MIILLVNWLFNGFLLSLIVGFIYLLTLMGGQSPTHHFLVQHEDAFIFGLGFGTAGLLTLIGMSNISHHLLRFFLGGRKPIGRELKIIDPVLSDVLEKVNQTHNTKYQREKMHIRVMDCKQDNAQAFGRNTIIVTQSLLSNSTEDELRAVLAHELGHLYYGDSVVLTAMIFGSLATRILMWGYVVYSFIAGIIAKIFNKDESAMVGCFALFPVLLFLPIVVLHWLGNKLLAISLSLIMRQYEYRADKFAKNLGYMTGLISFLEKAHDATEHDNSMIGRLFASHPAPMKRIGRLED